jgi:hypothetical protein
MQKVRPYSAIERLYIFLFSLNLSLILFKQKNLTRHAVTYLAEYYATSRNIACSIPDEVIRVFNLPNSSSRTTALGSTQPLTEMSTRNLPRSKRWPARKADITQPYGPPRPVIGIALLLPYPQFLKRIHAAVLYIIILDLKFS